MNNSDLKRFNKWFSDYCKSFCSSNIEEQKTMSLKIKHSHNVCRNIVQIASEEQLSQNKIMLAETIALFHDIGRFIQYRKYKTFNDTISVNHGRLGAEILKQEGVLHDLPENEQKLIVNTVRLHNAFKLPKQKNTENMLFLKLIRDADKLDIWRIFDEYYKSSVSERASVAIHGLLDVPEYSAKILSAIFGKKTAFLKDVKTLNDFKLMQLSWIYDLNFKTSYRLLVKRNYIEKITAKLPRTDEIKGAAASLQEFVSKKFRGDEKSID